MANQKTTDRLSTKQLISSNFFSFNDKYLLLNTRENRMQLMEIFKFHELDYAALRAEMDEFDRYWYVAHMIDATTKNRQNQIFDSVTYRQQIIGTPAKAYLIYGNHTYIIKYDVRDAYKLIRTLTMLDITKEQFMIFNETLKQINEKMTQL